MPHQRPHNPAWIVIRETVPLDKRHMAGVVPILEVFYTTHAARRTPNRIDLDLSATFSASM
jgi:hypothetical protein